MSKSEVSKQILHKNITALEIKIKDGTITTEEALTYFKEDVLTLATKKYLDLSLEMFDPFYSNWQHEINSESNEEIVEFNCTVKDLVKNLANWTIEASCEDAPFWEVYEDLNSKFNTILHLRPLSYLALNDHNLVVIASKDDILYKINFKVINNDDFLNLSKLTLEDFLTKVYRN